jgi:hypothetical protein
MNIAGPQVLDLFERLRACHYPFADADLPEQRKINE